MHFTGRGNAPKSVWGTGVGLEPAAGFGRSSWVVRADRPAAALSPRLRVTAAGLGLLAFAGCQTFGLPPALPEPPAPPVAAAPVSPHYPVCFPDVLEVDVAGRPDVSGPRLVYPDGRVNLGPAGEVFAEGCTTVELTRRVADTLGVPAQQVRCQVAAARSRVVYLYGSGAAEPRALPYRGPERATELLRRAGTFSSGAEVQVVRRNVARGGEAETFKIDLAAVRQVDGQTDVVLEPNDEVQVTPSSGVRLAAFFGR